MTTPESESETVVGGSGVLPVQTRNSWTSFFPQTKDREFWSWPDVKVLK